MGTNPVQPVWTDEQIDAIGKSVVHRLPKEILDALAHPETLKFKLGKTDNGAPAQMLPGTNEIIVNQDDPSGFINNPLQVGFHESLHEAQSELPHGLSTFPAIDKSNPYGDFGRAGVSDAHSRIYKTRHVISQMSPEEQGQVVSNYGAYMDAAENAKTPEDEAYYRQRGTEIYQPYLDEFSQVVRYGHVLTEQDALQSAKQVRDELSSIGGIPARLVPHTVLPSVELAGLSAIPAQSQSSSSPRSSSAGISRPIPPALKGSPLDDQQ